MNPLTGLVASLLALLPAVSDGPAEDAAAAVPESAVALIPGAPPAPSAPTVESFADMARSARNAEPANQVRIEQRVIIRIAPGPSMHPRDIRRGFSGRMSRSSGPRLVERRMSQCVSVGAIAGVQPDGPSRLVLFMRDQRIVSASLEKSCNARDFYSGFLVERSADGMICAGRDRLLARSGANCALGRLRQLVEIDDDE